MKKITFIIVSACLSLCLAILAACNNKEEQEIFYKITVNSDDTFSISDLETEAKEGQEISFDVNSESIFYEIDSVTMNGSVLTKGSFYYTFTMPASDVEIKVNMVLVDEYDDPNDHLAWGSDVDGKIYTMTEDSPASKQNINLNFVGISSANWITSIEDEILSSNEDVIPSSAITLETRKASTSNAIIGAYLVVDLTKIKEGTTMIYVNLDPNNASLGTLIKEFEVVDGASFVPETMEITLKFTNETDYDMDGMFINLTDTTTSEIYSIELKDLTNYETTFDYVVNHEYRLSIAYCDRDSDGNLIPNTQVPLDILEWQTGSLLTPNKIEKVDGRDHLYLLTINTANTVVDITIYE